MAKIASKAVRKARVAKGVAAAPKRFEKTRSEAIANQAGGSMSTSAKNIKERQRQERAVGIRRGSK
jgi:hypothetical protein